MKEETEKRIEFIDLIKGICIILIVMSHVGGSFSTFDSYPIVTCFRMPLYFFISGIFFRSYSGLVDFIIRKTNKLLIPFLFFYISAFALQYLISHLFPYYFQMPVELSELLIIFKPHALIPFNPPIWFLLALYNCCLLFYIVHYFRGKHLGLMFCMIAIIGATGFYLGKARISLPLYSDVAMTALPFYTAGFWIRRYNFFLYVHRFDKYIPILVIVALCIMYLTARKFGMRTNNYSGNIIQFYTAALTGIFMILLICKRIRKLKGISYLGRYSIIMLCIHGPIIYFQYRFFSRFITNELMMSITVFTMTLLTCTIMIPFFVKLLPKFVAQKDCIPPPKTIIL